MRLGWKQHHALCFELLLTHLPCACLSASTACATRVAAVGTRSLTSRRVVRHCFPRLPAHTTRHRRRSRHDQCSHRVPRVMLTVACDDCVDACSVRHDGGGANAVRQDGVDRPRQGCHRRRALLLRAPPVPQAWWKGGRRCRRRRRCCSADGAQGSGLSVSTELGAAGASVVIRLLLHWYGPAVWCLASKRGTASFTART